MTRLPLPNTITNSSALHEPPPPNPYNKAVGMTHSLERHIPSASINGFFGLAFSYSRSALIRSRVDGSLLSSDGASSLVVEVVDDLGCLLSTEARVDSPDAAGEVEDSDGRVWCWSGTSFGLLVSVMASSGEAVYWCSNLLGQ